MTCESLANASFDLNSTPLQKQHSSSHRRVDRNIISLDFKHKGKTEEEIKNYLGVNSLTFLSLDNLKLLLKEEGYCYGCFTEKYPVNRNEQSGTFVNINA